MRKHDAEIRRRIKEGWHLNEEGLLCKPSGEVHVKTTKQEGKYVQMEFWRKGKKMFVTYSRMICWLANGKPPTCRHLADHIDGNIHNNHPSNLRWLTPSENNQNTSREIKLARIRQGKELALQMMIHAEKYYKLNFDKADDIRYKFHVEGMTLKSLAEEYDVSRITISNVVCFKSWIRPVDPPDGIEVSAQIIPIDLTDNSGELECA